MIKFSWICRVCNPHYPCRMSFTGYDGVYPGDLSVEKKRHCISPFREDTDCNNNAYWEMISE